MPLTGHHTRIVATIGPASDSVSTIESMIRAGMRIARINLSHEDFDCHRARIERIRAAQAACGIRVTIMADLPGPKMRLGEIEGEPLRLHPDDPFTLTTDEIRGNGHRASMTFSRLPEVVTPGVRLFVNDGLIQLRVESIHGGDVNCRVVSGGELRSRKGLNLPGIDLGIRAFTERDEECLVFALGAGVDAISQSFVADAEDLMAVRDAARKMGAKPVIIAKIERAQALANLDGIMAAADGIMVARGDLGVEIPIEDIAVVQKDIIARARRLACPVITATQMLESMTSTRLPTRAESTDVANAILDGTDAVMLSGESAIGSWPVESVQMLAAIARSAEQRRSQYGARCGIHPSRNDAETIAGVVKHALENVSCAVVFVPTRSGATARMISRYKPDAWIVALCTDEIVCRGLLFSWGVHAETVSKFPSDWRSFARDWMSEHGVEGTRALLVAGPSPGAPETNLRIEFLHL